MQKKIPLDELTDYQVREIVRKTGKFPTELLTPYCKHCGYALEGVEQHCPECGEYFDLSDEATFSWFPPKDYNKLLMPAHVTAILSLVIAFYYFWLNHQFGWAFIIGLPFISGIYLGYLHNGKVYKSFGRVLLGLFILGCMVLMIMTQGPVGLFCGFILGVLLCIPIAFGVGAGVILRVIIRTRRGFDQRWWLFPIFIAVLPWTIHLIEKRLSPSSYQVVTVTRSYEFSESRDQVWRDFISTSKGPIPATGPLAAIMPEIVKVEGGQIESGATRHTTFRKKSFRGEKFGQISAYLNHVIPSERIDFEFVGQRTFENSSAQLVGGYFKFETIEQGRTRFVMSVTYEPKLQARSLWRPLEEVIIKSQCDARVGVMTLDRLHE